MHLEHILSYISVVMDFSSRGLGFLNSYTSDIFYLVPPLWWILFTQVKFSRLMHFGHILSYASIVIDFSLCGSGFPNSHTSSTFYLMPPL